MLAGDGQSSTTSSEDDIPLTGPHSERWGSAPMIPLSSSKLPRPPKLDVRNSSYTSLRDLVDKSPTCYIPDGVVTFRNPLLEHAAYAYLQPRESPGSLGDRTYCFRRRWPDDDPPPRCVGCVSDLCSFVCSCLFSLIRKGWMRDGDDGFGTTGSDRGSSVRRRTRDD